MRAFHIEAAPFVFTDIEGAKIRKEVNRPGSAWIRGVIDEQSEDDYLRLASGGLPVEITAIGLDGESKTIFQGYLENIHISRVHNLKVMELFIVSYSKLLDITPEIKVFQDTDLSYDKLVSTVLEPFADTDFIARCGDGQAIGQMFVQYQETAWAFLMRMASMWKDVLVPDDTLKGIRLYFGFPNRRAADVPPVSPISYDVRKDIQSYMIHAATALSESDFVYYIVKDREIRELGEPVIFQDRELFVVKIESQIEGQELVHFYTLKSRNGIRVQPYRNFMIIGASLSGQASDITGSHVKMSLPSAHSNDAALTKWHPFSTVYSSPDGSGWYAMPEKGDALRLYFPSQIEDEGYSISAVHHYGAPPQVRSSLKAAAAPIKTAATPVPTRSAALASGGNNYAQSLLFVPTSTPAAIQKLRYDEGSGFSTKGISPETSGATKSAGPAIDPDNKFIRNNSGKFILLSPEAIMISGEGGSILIQDGEGITIASNYGLTIEGKEDVSIASMGANTAIVGSDRVDVQQHTAAIELSEGKVLFKGVQVQTDYGPEA